MAHTLVIKKIFAKHSRNERKKTHLKGMTIPLSGAITDDERKLFQVIF